MLTKANCNFEIYNYLIFKELAHLPTNSTLLYKVLMAFFNSLYYIIIVDYVEYNITI